MRSVDTHQPKSTIFAHLLGLQSCLSPSTKRGDKHATFSKTCLQTHGEQPRSNIRGYGGPICPQLLPFNVIRMLGKWREGKEGDQLVTMWVNEGRLPLNVNI